MTSGSYNPNHTDELNPEYFICANRWHATNVAKYFAVYYFVITLGISLFISWRYGTDQPKIIFCCFVYTLYCILTMYGVLLEQRMCLIPFLLVQGVLCIAQFILTATFSFGGIFTNMIEDHHKDTQPLRDIYKMHGWNPDKQSVQTIAGTLVLLILLLSLIFNCFGLFSMWSTYKCYREQDRVRNPKYQRGIIADSEEV